MKINIPIDTLVWHYHLPTVAFHAALISFLTGYVSGRRSLPWAAPGMKHKASGQPLLNLGLQSFHICHWGTVLYQLNLVLWQTASQLGWDLTSHQHQTQAGTLTLVAQ
jgi:hypothetical protein